MKIRNSCIVILFLFLQSSCCLYAECQVQDEMRLPLFTLARETQQLVRDNKLDTNGQAPWLVETALRQHPDWNELFRQCTLRSDVVVNSRAKAYGVVLLCDKEGRRLLFEAVDCQFKPVFLEHTDNVPCAATLDIERKCP